MSTVTQERKTEVSKQAPFTIAPITFEATKDELKKLVASSGTITVKGIDDKDGIAKAHERRMLFRETRLNIEKRRKALKADSLEYGRQVDAVAKELTAIIEPEEKRLENEESIVKREQERIAKEAAEARQAMIRNRLNALKDCDAVYMAEDISGLPQDEFEALLGSHQADKKRRDAQAAADAAERERVAAEQKAEAERLEKVAADLEAKRAAAETRNKRAMARLELLARNGCEHAYATDELADMEPARWESVLGGARELKAQRDEATALQQAALDAQRAEQQAAEAKIDAEQRKLLYNKRIAELEAIMPSEYDPNLGKKIADAGISFSNGDLAAMTDDAFALVTEKVAGIVKARADEIEKAKADAIAEQARIAAAEKAHAEAAAAEQQRQEELRPDREKIAIFADSIAKMAGPQLSVKSQGVQVEIGQALLVCSKAIRAAGSKLK